MFYELSHKDPHEGQNCIAVQCSDWGTEQKSLSVQTWRQSRDLPSTYMWEASEIWKNAQESCIDPHGTFPPHLLLGNDHQNVGSFRLANKIVMSNSFKQRLWWKQQPLHKQMLSSTGLLRVCWSRSVVGLHKLFKKIRIYYLKDNCPTPNPDANTLDAVPSWTAVSGDQFITQFQGKAKKVLFQMPCLGTGLVGGWPRHSAAQAERNINSEVMLFWPIPHISQNIKLKVTSFDRALT